MSDKKNKMQHSAKALDNNSTKSVSGGRLPSPSDLKADDMDLSSPFQGSIDVWMASGRGKKAQQKKSQNS